MNFAQGDKVRRLLNPSAEPNNDNLGYVTAVYGEGDSVTYDVMYDDGTSASGLSAADVGVP